MPSLFQISQELDALFALCEQEGTTAADRERLIDEWFNENEAVLLEKVDAYAGLVRQLEAEAEILQEEESRLGKRRKSRQGLAKTLRARLALFLARVAPDGLKTPRNTVSVLPTKPKYTLTCKPEELPKEFQSIKEVIQPDWEAIEDALAGGEVLDFVVKGGEVPFVRFN